MEEKIIHEVETFTGSLKVYEDCCIVSRKKNMVNLLITNKFFSGDKKFYFSDLTSVQFRKPGMLTDGYLEFEYPGSRSRSDSGAYTSENAFTFGKDKTEEVEKIYHYIDRKIREYKSRGTSVVQESSPADELKKYKDLLDNGVITQEEFDTKKKQILGF